MDAFLSSMTSWLVKILFVSTCTWGGLDLIWRFHTWVEQGWPWCQVTILFSWGSWKFSSWHDCSNMARFAYAWVSRALSSWVIGKHLFMFVNASPLYTREYTTSFCPLGKMKKACQWVIVDVWKFTSVVFPRFTVSPFLWQKPSVALRCFTDLHEIKKDKIIS